MNAQAPNQLGYALIKSSDCEVMERLHTALVPEQRLPDRTGELDKLKKELHYHDLMSLLQFMVTLGVIAVAWFFR